MKQAVYDAKVAAAEDRIGKAWKAMHHNASLSGTHPELRNDYEYDLFRDWLNDEVGMSCDECERQLVKKFGIHTKVYSAGRQGATFYPDVFHSHVGGNGFGRFRWDCFHRSYYSDREEVQDKEKVAKALEWFNAYWKREAASAKRRWNAHKRSNKLGAEIRSYDGKTKRHVEVWA